MSRSSTAFELVPPLCASVVLGAVLAAVWAARLPYPFDLEWMEGGMLAHAWRLQRGLPLYVAPNPDFVPFVYPPGYAAVVAALGSAVGLSLPLGRAVSVASTLLAAGALAFGARTENRGSLLLLPLAAVFLGTYPQVGASYDLVRPDALALALASWALVVGREEGPRAPWAAGLLLAGAFFVKHNFAAFGVPMALGLAVRGWRPAGAFVAASVGPAVAGVVGLELWSDGGFLTWLLEVPGAHPLVWARAGAEVPSEWGTALPVVWGAVGLAATWAATRQRAVPLGVAAGAPPWFGAVIGWWATRAPPVDETLRPGAYGLAWWALGAVVAAGVIRGVAAVVDRAASGPWPDRSAWRPVYDGGVLITAAAIAGLMRVHESGWVNVHAPLFWCLSLQFGRVFGQWWAAAPAPGRRALSAALTLQLCWSALLVDHEQLTPDADDEAAGRALVDALREVEGPVLSPFSAWTPTYAGHPPSVHAMGVWDCDFPGGPYHEQLEGVEAALREHHWGAFATGDRWFHGDPTRFYREEQVIVPAGEPTFLPLTGFMARPTRILVPRRGPRPR